MICSQISILWHDVNVYEIVTFYSCVLKHPFFGHVWLCMILLRAIFVALWLCIIFDEFWGLKMATEWLYLLQYSQRDYLPAGAEVSHPDWSVKMRSTLKFFFRVCRLWRFSHNLALICRWDPAITRDIIAHWFALMQVWHVKRSVLVHARVHFASEHVCVLVWSWAPVRLCVCV